MRVYDKRMLNENLLGMDLKICWKCERLLALDEFPNRSGAKSGKHSWCKDCFSGANKEWSASNREQMNRLSIKWRHNNKEKVRDYCRSRVDKTPEVSRANNAVYSAVKSGRLARACECSVCDSNDKTEAHHWSYKKENRLDVYWLCKSCHESVHHGEFSLWPSKEKK